MTFPLATARLQLHSGFSLSDACAQVSYYAQLGVSHLYLSPISTARPGSTHGYDVIDHSQVSPELGGEKALAELALRLRERGMGLILDIVPNHMATNRGNAWWWDILQQGAASTYGNWLDIDWNPPEPALRGKVLAPFLDAPYAAALETGKIKLVFDEISRSFLIEACGSPYPLAPGTLADSCKNAELVLAFHDSRQAQGRQNLHELLERQHYRLAWWRYAADGINWRRFFEINELIGVRVELPEVFDAVHALPLRLYAQGLIDGLRIDHVDGLADPGQYCRTLRTKLMQAAQQRPGAFHGDEPWLIVEKILAGGEKLDPDWPVQGTSGYDFMDQVGAVLHDSQAEPALTAHWNELADDKRPPVCWIREARQLMLDYHFVAERKALLDVLSRLAQSSIDSRDLSTDAIARVLDPLLVAFLVYRTYAGDAGRNHHDAALFTRLLSDVRRRASREQDPQCYKMLDAWLGGIPAAADNDPLRLRGLHNEATRRFQQLTPPLAAKSLEDTVFYRYGRLLSRNEVGSDLSEFALSPEAFHLRNSWRARQAPYAMLATATHDHKRGEDTRARLATLTEIPDQWVQASRLWLQWPGLCVANAQQAAERYVLFQTLVGAWPLDLEVDDAVGMQGFLERVVDWQIKTLREAKISSGWFAPDLAYEQAAADFIYSLRPGEAGENLSRKIRLFAQQISPAAAVKSLAQVLLRNTVPGVPDLYQGTEFWDFSLVDPDNRREVDFSMRRKALQACKVGIDVPAMLTDWKNGHIKQAVLAYSLQLRRELPTVFTQGEYVALSIRGRGSRHVLAFMRSWQGQAVVVVVPHLCSQATETGRVLEQPVIDSAFWGDTCLILPARYQGSQLFCALRNTRLRCAADGSLRLGELLSGLPVALLRVE